MDIFRRSGIHGWRRKQKLFGKPTISYFGVNALRYSLTAAFGTAAALLPSTDLQLPLLGRKFLRNKQRDRFVVLSKAWLEGPKNLAA